MIRNGLKRTISASGGLGLLQMVLELGTKRCVSEDVEPLNRLVFKTVRLTTIRNGPKRTISVSGGLLK